MDTVLRVGILGASGYTGAELLRLLLRHPRVKIAALTAERNAGQPLAAVFPQFHGQGLPDLVRMEDVDFSGLDVVFAALPHGLTQKALLGLPEHVVIVDLSADFRLRDPEVYAEWYGHSHEALALQARAVYGLSEFARADVAKAQLIANPGCYPTSAQLPLIPLVAAGLVDADDIVIDAKSGVSGAGREAKVASLFTEVAEGIHAYGVAAHRHAPEIEQGLSDAAGRAVRVSFTPHLMPMSRGILSTMHLRLTPGVSASDLSACLGRRFADEPFVTLLPQGHSPQTRHLRGTNAAHIAVFADRLPHRAIVLCAIDNLVKGASGQAVQNMNIRFGLAETMGLDMPALFP